MFDRLVDAATADAAQQLLRGQGVMRGEVVAWLGLNSLQMVATLRGNAVPVWFLMADDEGHGFAKKKNIEFQFYATVQFIKTYLLGDEA